MFRCLASSLTAAILVAAAVAAGACVIALWPTSHHTTRSFESFREVPVWHATAAPGSSAHARNVAQLVEQALELQTPVIVRGGVSHWLAVEDWTADTLAQKLLQCAPGTKLQLQTTVVEQDDGRGAYAEVPVRIFAEWLRAEAETHGAAGGISATPRFYLSEMEDIDELCPELLQDLSYLIPFDEVLPWGAFIPYADDISNWFGHDISELTGLYAPFYPVLWWGPAGTRTGLHYDIEKHNLLGQVRGKKNVTFISPDQSARLYPSTIWDNSAVLSKVDMWAPDMPQYPKYALAAHTHVTIRPGDLLIIPQDWWHAVESLEEAISVSIRVDRTTWREILYEGLDLLHDVGLWPLPQLLGGDGAGCTCHRESITVESVEEMRERFRLL